jgi:hypothetical protein
MQNNYQGPAEKFAMVVPVPVVLQKENVKTLPRDVFAKVDQLSSPRLVEYWEVDPCQPPPREEESDRAPTAAGLPPPVQGAAKGGLGVTVEAEFTVGEYEVVILSAKDAGGLDAWLRQNRYTIPDGAAAHFRPYVQRGSKFFVAKVDPAKVTFDKGMATLSPLRFHYDDEAFNLPIRLGLINAKDAQDLVVYVLADNQRYEVANYPNTTIPTNLDVADSARKEFGAFYTALFDRTLERTPRAVVTEYAWAPTNCDPCPGPVLDARDLVTFGGDVLPGAECPDKPGAPYRPECDPSTRFMGFVLTRLHARYTSSTLGEDLVFRAAPPIVGGREMPGPGGLEHGATRSSINNFQARYAIRHPWTGPIACKTPRRGIWGGPPAGAQAPAAPSAAPPSKELAVAPRGTSLAPFVRSEIPEIGWKPDPGALPPVSGVSAPSPASMKDPPPGPAAGPARTSKCGCDAPGVPVRSSAALLAGLGVAGVVARRRKPATAR